MILHRIDDRVRGMGDFLVEVHEWLREELRTLGAGALVMEKSLKSHCVSFCEALAEHHTGEDMGAFPLLAQRFPALGPVLTTLGGRPRRRRGDTEADP